MFWSEWKINVNVLYEDISDNVRSSEGAIEICTKVSCEPNKACCSFGRLCRPVYVYTGANNRA